MNKQDICRKIILYVFTLICFLNILIMQPGITLSQPDVPNANTAIDNPVPLNVIKKIALVKSRQTWGQGVLGEPIPLSNLNGDLIVYDNQIGDNDDVELTTGIGGGSIVIHKSK